jgi:hypothetical protein
MRIHPNRVLPWIPSQITVVVINPSGMLTAIVHEESPIEIYPTFSPQYTKIERVIPPHPHLNICLFLWITKEVSMYGEESNPSGHLLYPQF